MEAGRDQGHSLMGVGLMATVCEMAWNQGIDLYGYDDNRFLKGAQYVAKWSLGESVPYTPYASLDNRLGIQHPTAIAAPSPTQVRPVWAMVANHYTQRRGLPAPYLTQIAAKAAPEGGGGDYGPNSGGFDQLGFGTLAFTRDKTAATDTTTPPAASASGASAPRAQTTAGPSATPSASASTSTAAAEGHLAATGSGEVVGWAAAAGITATAGGLLFLRRRNQGRHGAS